MHVQAAFATTGPPSQAHFWARVARQVPGKTEQQCMSRHFAPYPTPPKAKPRKLPKALQAPGPAPVFAGQPGVLSCCIAYT